MEIIRHRKLGTKIKDVTEADRENRKSYERLTTRKAEIESWRQILAGLVVPSRELDLMIYRGLEYPTWYRSKVMRYTLVDDIKLLNVNFMSRHTKMVPEITSSVDAVFKAFGNLGSDDNDITLKLKTNIRNKPKTIRCACKIKSDYFVAEGYGINLASALLDAMLADMIIRIKCDLGGLIAYANEEETIDDGRFN